MKSLKQPIVIFSVFQKGLSHSTNNANHEKALDFLTEYNVIFKDMSGSYKGIPEKSIMLFADDEYVAFSLTAQYNQDTYLFSDADRSTFLKSYPKEHGEYIGTLRPSTKAAALKLDSWSLIDGRYFSVERG